MSRRSDSPCYLIAAGEHSGDILGADLVLALRERLPKMTAFGVTGAAMRRAEVTSLEDISAFSVMGISDVVGKLPELCMLEARILSWVDKCRPRFAVLIDNPGFNLRLAEQLKLRGIVVYQYVAPKVWAWGAKRIPRLRANIDMILGILPFEAEFFASHGVNYTYVGSPLKDRIEKVIVRRETFGLAADQVLIACLPGSRPSEIERNMPTLIGVAKLVQKVLPQASFIVPVAQNIGMTAVADVVRNVGGGELKLGSAGISGLNTWHAAGLSFVQGMSLEIMASADAAIVASGTATLECALLGTPMVVVYSLSELSYQFAIKVVKVPYASLVNLLFGRLVVKEYIQRFRLSDIAAELLSLVQDKERNQAMRSIFGELRDQLRGMAAPTAAALIVSRLTQNSP